MQTKPYFLTAVACASLLASCTSNKNNTIVSQAPVKNVPVETSTETPVPNASTALSASQPTEMPQFYASSDVNIVSLEAASKGTKYEKTVTKLKEALAQVEKIKQEQQLVSTNTNQKMNFAEKMVVKKLEKQYKKASSQAASGFHSWNSFLKVGVILLVLGIILTILGLGGIGGLSALVGLIFTIIGLLAEF